MSKAVMAGLCAGHPRSAATNLSPAQTSVSSEAYDQTEVFSWMAGSSPATTEKRKTSSTAPNTLEPGHFFAKTEYTCYGVLNHRTNLTSDAGEKRQALRGVRTT